MTQRLFWASAFVAWTAAACDDDRLFSVEIDEPEVPPLENPRVPIPVPEGTPSTPPPPTSCEPRRGELVSIPQAQAVDFVFYLDQSGSMGERIGGGPRRYDLALSSLRQVVASLDPSVEIAIQTFPRRGGASAPATEPLPSEVIGFCGACARPDCAFEGCASDRDCASGLCRGGLCTCSVQRACNSGFSCVERFCDGGPAIPNLADTLLNGSLSGLIAGCTGPNECWTLRNDRSAQCRSFNEIFRDLQGGGGNAGGDCQPATFEVPVLPFSSGTQADQVLADLGRQGPRGDTPLGPALAGMRTYVEGRQAMYPGRRTVQVVVTDGDPTDCAVFGPDEIEDLVRALRLGPQEISTFLVGVFEPDSPLIATLRPIAQAGGHEPLVVAPNVDFEGAFFDAIKVIETTVASCQLQLPDLGGVDLGTVEIELTRGGGTESLQRVDGRSYCGSTPRGWFFNHPTSPSAVELCPEACTEQEEAGSTFNYTAACR